MAFTNTWDNAVPADTQAANQLGADLRAFRLDVQQRMAAISGADAAKETFEAGFAGVLFFATDTGKAYRWGGGSWTEVTDDLLANIYAPKASPTFTGVPAAPTAAVSTNTTQLATTAFVIAQLAASLPAPTETTAGVLKVGPIIFQWKLGAEVTTADSTQVVTFPETFPTACLAVMTTNICSGSNQTITKGWGVQSFTAANVTVVLQRRGDEGSFTVQPQILAIGH